MTAGATSRQRHVLFVQITADRYGSDRALTSLARGLVERGWRVTVVVPYSGPLVGDLEGAGAEVRIHPVGALRRVFTMWGWLRFVLVDLPASVLAVRRIARTADVVHVNTALVLGGAVGGRLARRPLVWHIRESMQELGWRWRVYARAMGWLADAIVANSEAIAAGARAGGLSDKTVLIHDGLQLGPAPGFPRPGRGVVAVGRINAGKGHGVLVEAVAELRDRGVRIDVDIAGDVFPGAEANRRRLEADISRHGVGDRVRLLGFVDDIDALLERARIFVFPSTTPESFGLALAEAMGHGLACVATDHGGPAEIIRDGETGLLVPPGDPSALADAIARLWVDPALCDRLGQAAAADVRRRFGADQVVRAVAGLYDRVLEGR